MNPDELLLRDIHLPDPVSWWPPAIGWWIFVSAVVALIVAVTWWRRRQTALRHSPVTLARNELNRLRAAWAGHGDAQRLVKDVSTWLRCAGMSLSSRRRAASLTGVRWRQCLDDIAGEPVFGAQNEWLITAIPYRALEAANDPVDGEHLLDLCERWLEATARRTRQGVRQA